ncbi:MAG TPA: M1 family metallopeptidase [candidate division Zixibacteria bacterium]|nr:M1 family metallopeptidase [candidate division Zixibacteria bacterium]
MSSRKPYRLPATATPERYELRLTPDLKARRFAGEVKISLVVREPTPTVTLNAAELELGEVAIAGPEGRTLAGRTALDAENEQATLEFPETLQPGRWELRIGFRGTLNDKLHGFYHSTYRDEQGREKSLACTQFESTDARRAFPCWDEPAFKAVFQVTLVIDEGLTAISNTRVVRERPLPETGKKEVVFADSMKMSTYLVAFIVGELEATEPVWVGPVPLRVWSVPGKSRLGSFAREIGRFSLEYFSRYYDLPYPGDKLDLIAIPDFASGAMENLGAITFRETALLVDEARATRAELERVADVVAHENAHMWFGDLVTMRWWNGLWLNEAFATFMEMMAVDAWKPEWRRWESFTASRAAAMQVDGLASTRPIEFPVEKPEEAAGMFDVLTYEKGASVLRMLEQYLKPEVFRDGIRLYLRRHAYANAETTDLWDALEEAARLPARALMDSWIFQAGYPLIAVKRDGGELVLSQEIFRYLRDGDVDRKWHVPVFLRFGTAAGTVERTLLLTDRSARVELPAEARWVVANAGAHGFYRVRYSGELAACLKAGLRDKLSPAERFNFFNDAWAIALAGITSLEDYLSLLELLAGETDLNVWTTILIACHQLNRILEDDQVAAFRERLRLVLGPAVERVGWSPRDGESDLDRQLRADLIGALGVLADERSCQERAQELYSLYEQNSEAVEPNLVPALLSIVAHTGGLGEYEKFRARFKSARTPQEEQRYLFALAGFRSAELIERTLELTLSGEVRTQNAPYLMRSLLLNRDARERAWRFMKENWQRMIDRYPDNSIPRMCEGVVALSTPDLEADVRAFFAAHPVRQGARQIEQHLERLRVAVAARERWRRSLVGEKSP